MTSSHFFIFLKGGLPQISLGLELILVFGFIDFGVLWFILILMDGSRRVSDWIFRACCFLFLRICMAGAHRGLARISVLIFFFFFCVGARFEFSLLVFLSYVSRAFLFGFDFVWFVCTWVLLGHWFGVRAAASAYRLILCIEVMYTNLGARRAIVV